MGAKRIEDSPESSILLFHQKHQMTPGLWNRYKMTKIYIIIKNIEDHIKFEKRSWSFWPKTGFWVHMQAMNEIETFPLADFQSLVMSKSPLKDFVISWKMCWKWLLPFLKYDSLPEPQKLIFFAEIWNTSQRYAKQLSHKISTDLSTHKWSGGPI